MRLRVISPRLPDALIDALEQCNIRTDTDLMFTGTAMQIYEKLPPGTVTLAELEKIIQDAICSAAVQGLSCDELILIEEEKRSTAGSYRLDCGVPALDELINGYSGPRVLEISGERGSGKSVSKSQPVAW